MELEAKIKMTREVESVLTSPANSEQLKADFVIVGREGDTFAVVAKNSKDVPTGTLSMDVKGRQVYLFEGMEFKRFQEKHRMAVARGVHLFGRMRSTQMNTIMLNNGEPVQIR